MARLKLKTHRGTAKRIKVTATGKYIRRRAKLRHILTTKSRDQKRNLKGPAKVDASVTRMMGRLLPNQ
ncbi:MAG TPA: 50S ribosomal protein L35 [Nitrospirales bacterium]|nr:50S ribosomal protein L35 [Nitrospirales bacterium]HIC05166.1 50S ribosomal protein L35 [Nitrospirales bacterium]HIO21780.1 50S ribosomal protein L35 [Nitrospirales bacterium]HIO69907.1 50S ribosomal protein L35 [Nitrospirales bacterium]